MKGTVAELKKVLKLVKDNDVLVIPYGRDGIKQAEPTIVDVLVFGKKREFGEEVLEWNGDPREYDYETMDDLHRDGGKIVKALIFK